MENGLTARKKMAIDAPAPKVWEALTTPALIKKYFYGTDTESEWKVGSPIIFKGKWQGVDYIDKGTILDVKPGKMLQYNYWSSFSGTEDKPENYATITYELFPRDCITELEVTQNGIASEEMKDRSEKNWEQVLGNLKEMLEPKGFVTSA